MSEVKQFANRKEFREWLSRYGKTHEGIWLVFGKAGGPQTVKASEALEEALCFGWIDGQMARIDGQRYQKFFSMRRPNSKWSEKNKALAGRLEQQGLMTEEGRRKIEEARKNGQWDAPKPPEVTEEQIAQLTAILKDYEPAYTHFMGMSPSVQKTYGKGYYAAKTEAGRQKRLSWMIDRLNQNLKPM